MGLSMNGLSEFRDAFQRLGEQSPEKLGEAAKKHLETDVLPKSQLLVPELTGALKGTARVVPGSKPNSWAVKYGDSPVQDRSAVDYAAAVHERDARHIAPTEYKFLETPLKESVDAFKNSAAKALDELAGGG